MLNSHVKANLIDCRMRTTSILLAMEVDNNPPNEFIESNITALRRVMRETRCAFTKRCMEIDLDNLVKNKQEAIALAEQVSKDTVARWKLAREFERKVDERVEGLKSNHKSN